MQWYNDYAGKDELVLFCDGSYNKATGQGGWAVIRALGSNGRSNVYEHWCSGSITVADRMLISGWKLDWREAQIEATSAFICGVLER